MTRNKAMQTIEECGKIQIDNLRRNTLSNNLKVPLSVDTEWKIMHSKKWRVRTDKTEENSEVWKRNRDNNEEQGNRE